MIIFFVLGLVLGIMAIVFALQNVAVATVTFFGWQLTGSLSLVLLLAVISGILATILILLPKTIGNYFRYRKLQKENNKLSEELRKQKELTAFAKTMPPTPEAIAKIEDGVIAHPEE